MSTSSATGRIASRILNEGYGPGAWHGPDLKAALDDVAPSQAFTRPAAGRHNIAEMACITPPARGPVRTQISGRPAEPFVLDGDDRFEVAGESTLSWAAVLAAVEAEQQRLNAVVAPIEAGTAISPLSDAERFNLVLGITCHAVCHAGQIQLVKRLLAS